MVLLSLAIIRVLPTVACMRGGGGGRVTGQVVTAREVCMLLIELNLDLLYAN